MRPRGYTFPEGPEGRSPPTATEAEALARAHRFPSGFDLASRLSRCWQWWRADVQIGPDLPASAHKAFLLELAKRSERLEEAMTKAGPIERKAIMGQLQNVDWGQLQRLLHDLQIAATVAARKLPASEPGRRGNSELMDLLHALIRLYRDAFGKSAPRITKTDKYGGKFFRFAADVLALPSFNVRITSAALGRGIEKALAGVDGRRTKAETSASPK